VIIFIQLFTHLSIIKSEINMKRRQFLKSAAPLAVVPLFGNKLFASTINPLSLDESLRAAAFAPETDRVLVVVQMSGGNDGLNTVLPLDKYSQMAAARSNILIPDTQVLRLGSFQTGLHPSMTGMKTLYDQKKLTVVQGVSYASPNFSHFRATDIFSTGADSNENLTTGWLGRYLENAFPGFPDNYPNTLMPDPLAVRIGSSLPLGLQGYELNTAQTVPTSFNGSITQLLSYTNTTPQSGNMGIELAYLREQQSFANQYAARIISAWNGGANTQTYSTVGSNLGTQLKVVARLIKGGLKTRIYWVNIGSFDTHSAQLAPHAALLGEMSDAIKTFQDDLTQMGLEDRVLGMTFSEFGRRIKSNGSAGTDHGSSAPMFLFGKKVNPTIIGSNPNLPANAGVNDQVPMQYDYRAIYQSILQGWFCMTASEAEATLGDSTPIVPAVNTECSSALPVELISFNAEKANKADAHLSWRTANENNTDHFEIQRSTDGKAFIKMGQVKAKGHTHEAQHYEFFDQNLPLSTNSIFYYRLKINDLDGTFAYSEAKTILFNKDGSKIVAEVYPNPSHGSIQLKINGGVQSDLMTEVVVNDYLGRQVLRINQQLAVDSIVDLNLEGKAMGVYIVIIRNGNSSLVQKVVIQ
jgi:uncharacterized protein (DUF1501 family)